MNIWISLNPYSLNENKNKCQRDVILHLILHFQNRPSVQFAGAVNLLNKNETPKVNAFFFLDLHKYFRK